MSVVYLSSFHFIRPRKTKKRVPQRYPATKPPIKRTLPACGNTDGTNSEATTRSSRPALNFPNPNAAVHHSLPNSKQIRDPERPHRHFQELSRPRGARGEGRKTRDQTIGHASLFYTVHQNKVSLAVLHRIAKCYPTLPNARYLPERGSPSNTALPFARARQKQKSHTFGGVQRKLLYLRLLARPFKW